MERHCEIKKETSFKEKYFGLHPRGFKNGFLISLLMIIAIMLLGALGGPLSPILFTGLMSTFLALSLLAGAYTIGQGLLLSFQQKNNKKDYNIFQKFINWAKTHPIQLAIGVLLCAALIVLFGLLGGGISLPFLTITLGFIAKGLASAGLLLGLETSLLGLNILAGVGLSLTLFTGWDVACRIGNHCIPHKTISEDLYSESLNEDLEILDAGYEVIQISSSEEVSEESEDVNSDREYSDNDFFGRKF